MLSIRQIHELYKNKLMTLFENNIEDKVLRKAMGLCRVLLACLVYQYIPPLHAHIFNMGLIKHYP